MRTRRLVSILPLMILGSACGVESVDADASSTVDAQISVMAQGRGLQALQAQRPDFAASAGDLSFKRSLVDGRGQTHERLSQSYRGIPVFGGEAVVHMNAD